jgi:peptidoglycan/LPS O-acetylase OafA/YrhL
MKSSPSQPSHFRPDIQALRALAVTLVVAYHLSPSLLPGGYVGVDVFFVISGYLIVGHISRSLEQGRFSVTDFWARRARRLLPAAFVVLVACLALVFLVLPGTRWVESFTQIGASALYVQNWVLATQAVDYMALGSAPSIVQHFWSLSVEEQFYIVIPIVVLLVWSARKSTRALFVTLLVIGVASFAYSIVDTITQPSIAYFSTGTRAWEFLAGGLLSFFPTLRGWARHVAAWAGSAVVIASALLFTGATPFPGVLAAIPVIGTMAILASAGAPSMPWATSRPIQQLGDISYSVYLWHWPLIVAYPFIVGHTPGLVGIIVLVVITLVVAALSKRFIEDPFRAPRTTRRWPSFAFAAIAAITVIAVSTVGVQVSIRQAAAAEVRVAEVTQGDCWGAAVMVEDCEPRDLITPPEFTATDYPAVQTGDCSEGTLVAPLGDNVECLYGDPDGSRTVVLTGDSHAMQWMPALQTAAESHGWKLITMVRSSCPIGDFTVIIDGSASSECAQWRDEAMARIIALDPDLVVTAALTGYGYEVVDYSIGDTETQRAGYDAALAELSDADIATVVIRDTPYLPVAGPDCVAEDEACQFERSVIDNHDDVLAEVAAARGVPTLDFTEYLCTTSECPAVIGGVIVYRDRNHLSQTFVRTLAPYVDAALLTAVPALAG